MSTAYRTGPSTVRRALVERRDALLQRSTDELAPALVEELDGLAASLDTAGTDPVDHVAEQLRQYEMTLEAGLAAGRQLRDKRWRSVLALAALVTAGALSLSGRLLWQLRDYDHWATNCAQSYACNGQCHLDVKHDGLLGVAYSCIAVDAQDCTKSCAEDGSCAVFDGVCKPAGDEDCAQSRVCVEHGQCEAFAGRCVVRSTDDCLQSTNCGERGQCSFSHAARSCHAADDRDCMASQGCVLRGECTESAGRCVVAAKAERADCARMAGCVSTGFCPEDESLPPECAAMLGGDLADAERFSVATLR